MEDQAKEGETRPLTAGAPQNEANPAQTGQAALPLYAAPAQAREPAPGRTWFAAALFSYLPAYLYVRGLLFGPGWANGWGIALFAAVFMAAVEGFARAEKRAPARETPFWAGCWLALSAAIPLWGLQNGGLAVWQILVWHMLAVWYVLARTGMLAAGHSGSLVALDGLVGFFWLPWKNIFRRALTVARGLWARCARLRRGQGQKAAIALISLGAAALVCALAWGQLAAADAHFAAIGGGVGAWLNRVLWNNENLVNRLVWFVFSLPVGAWLFGLVGGALRCEKPPLGEKSFFAALAPLQKLPTITVSLVLGALCAVYALFFAVQTLEFSSALGGRGLTAPDAAAFAVDGFWELCRVLLLNFAVLGAIRFFSAAPLREQRRQKWLAAVFCGFGIAFAALGGAKLAVYILLYGFTPRRVVSGWFLCVLALWAVLALVWVLRPCPAARIGVLALAASFVLLSCANPNEWIVRANLARYTAGQDAVLDTDLLQECGFAQAPFARAHARLLLDSRWLIGQDSNAIRQLYGTATEHIVSGSGTMTVVLDADTELRLVIRAQRCTAAALAERGT